MSLFYENGLNKEFRFSISAFLAIVIWCLLFGCTLKRDPLPDGMIPKIDTLNVAEEKFGRKLYEDLNKEYKLYDNPGQIKRMIAVFDRLIQAAGSNHLSWHLNFFYASDIVNVRAVHGNRIFIWSGFLDTVENEDEMAGILACEIAHVLARHTEPVEFNIWSQIFFEIGSLATSLAVMVASQGTVAISAPGWMKWVYIETADLDPLDRVYDEALEMEATSIALLILARTEYDPTALQTFWERIQKNPSLSEKAKGLYREMKPKDRVAMLDELLIKPSTWPQNMSD